MPSPFRHRFDVETSPHGAVVKFHPKKLNDTDIQALGEQLFRLIDEHGQYNLELDLSNVEAVGSMELARFVALHKKVRAVGGQLTLLNVAALVYEVFQITRLDTLLDVRRKEAG